VREIDRAILDLERRFANAPADGRKEHLALVDLGLSPTRYAQQLNALLSSRAALEHDPVTVNRLRRLRASRQRQKSVRRSAV
jgi:hypothetical protein